ncbi:hypothetical protein BmMC_00004 [Borrelia miyamotoi]|nr:hypothetical protein BmMC_00004 [Borrelia miyamotoi]
MYEVVSKIFSKKMLNVFSMHKLKILIFLFLSEDNFYVLLMMSWTVYGFSSLSLSFIWYFVLRGGGCN